MDEENSVNEESVDDDEAKQNLLYSKIPDDGTLIGNIALRDLLKWSPEKYLEIRKPLLESGKIQTGRGRGGSVRRVKTTLSAQGQTPSGTQTRSINDKYPDEYSLYLPLGKTIKEKWIPEKSYESAIVENTAHGGARKDGIWTRPDITVAAMISYTYVPGRHFEVVTFEIKHFNALDVTAVYEAGHPH